MKHIVLCLILFSSVIFSQNYPNDPKYQDGSQWNIHNDYSGNSSLRNDVDIDILEGWDITKGDLNVVIVILDSGIPMSNGLPSHNDLKNSNRIIFGEDYANDSTPFNDTRGHGTRVTGIAGAETNNSEGIAGIAPECKLMIYKVMEGNDDKKDEWAQRIYDSIIDIVNYKNQHSELRFVINISIGFKENETVLESAISLAQSNNILVVAGAGNWNAYSGFDVLYPAKYSVNYNNVISVASINKMGRWANEFSCYGPEVTVCAPGTDIWTTIPNNGYASDDGTSYSSPIVAGLAALMLSVDKNLTPAQIKSRIINSVNDVGETGFDHKTGYGLVNAFNALSELYVDKNPQSTLLSGNLDLSKQASDIYITLNHTPPSGVAAGRYIVDRYIAQKTVNHSIIDANTWYLGMKGYGYYEGSSTISHSYYLSSNIASNSFYFGTYFYYVKHEVPSGSVNKWIPWNPHVDGGLNYAVLGIGLAPPIITSLTQSPDPICQGSHGYVYCNLSQGNGNLSYTWTAADLPSGAYITPLGNRCKVTYPNTAKSSDGSSDKIMAPVNEITCIVTNSAGSDTESRSVYFDNDCGSQCPTLAFEHNGKIVNDNPILTKSVSSKPDVTDYYLVQNEVAKTDKKIKLLIHEPAVEHTYLDQVELMEVKVNPNEYVSVSEEGEIVNYKLSRERITFSLGGKEDIGSLLSSNDNNKAQFIAGDSLIIYSDQISTQTKDDLYFVIDGEGPIYKDKTAGVLSTTGLGKTSSANNNKDIYLRPEKSVVGIKLDKNIQNKLTIEFLQDVEIDFISIVKNEKTAKVNKLKLLEAVHSKNGDVKSLVLNIDKNYSEILPGERIDFTFESASSTDEKTAYILKSAGRYERDNVGEMKKGSQKENGVEEIIPTETKLLGNYPNPFNPTTIINFQLKEPGFVSLKVYDVIGREVADLINETKNAGIYKISFDASDLASGIYIYRLRANDFVSSKKMLLAK